MHRCIDACMHAIRGYKLGVQGLADNCQSKTPSKDTKERLAIFNCLGHTQLGNTMRMNLTLVRTVGTITFSDIERNQSIEIDVALSFFTKEPWKHFPAFWCILYIGDLHSLSLFTTKLAAWGVDVDLNARSKLQAPVATEPLQLDLRQYVSLRLMFLFFSGSFSCTFACISFTFLRFFDLLFIYFLSFRIANRDKHCRSIWLREVQLHKMRQVVDR